MRKYDRRGYDDRGREGKKKSESKNVRGRK